MIQKINYKADNSYWFTKDNVYNDVILSTRVRLLRNIINFPFEINMSDKDKQALSKSIVPLFSSHKEYSLKNYWTLDYNSLHYYQDLNLITQNKAIVDNDLFTDIIYANKEKDRAIILNEKDHIKIISLCSGLSCDEGINKVSSIDNIIYSDKEYCHNDEFGFLTSKLNEAGSGMKISLRIFIPFIMISGEYVKLSTVLKKKNCFIKKVFPESRKEELSSCIFDIFLNNSIEGTEEEQKEAINTIGIMVVEKERKLRDKVADNYPTIVLNQISQMTGLAKDSLLLEYNQGLNIILAIKTGLELGLLSGVTHTDLNSLCYEIKGELIRSLLYKNDITFEKDVKENDLLVQRLRTIVIQNALTGITHAN